MHIQSKFKRLTARPTAQCIFVASAALSNDNLSGPIVSHARADGEAGDTAMGIEGGNCGVDVLKYTA
jgi:hypothetical protein